MVLVVATKPTGEKVIAESSEAKAWGYSYSAPVGTITHPIGNTIEQNITSTQTSGTMQAIGGYTTSYHFAEPEIKQAQQIEQANKEISPKLAQGVSGYYVQSSSGTYVPVSAGVANLINANDAAASSNAANMSAWAAIAPQNRNTFTTDAGIKTFTLPQTYTQSTTLEQQIKSNSKYFKTADMAYTPETVGWERWTAMQNIMGDTGYQTAFMLKKLVTGEGILATGAGAIAALAGKYPEYQKWLQARWTGEQQAETYQMSQFGSKIVSDVHFIQHDVIREQFMQAKAAEIIPPAAMWIAPAFMGTAFSAIVGAGKIATATAQLWAKVGVVAMGAGVAYGTSEVYQGVTMGTPEGFYRAAAGIEIGSFSAYGLKQMWATAFPKKMLLSTYTMEYQGYTGESRELRGQYPKYQYLHEYRYADVDVKNLPSTALQDEAVFIQVKGYRLLDYAGEGGYPVKQDFNIMAKFRIDERAGVWKPLMQNLEEVNIKYPAGIDRMSMVNLGVNYYGTNIGKPDIVYGFTFEQAGYSKTVPLADWEKQFKTIPFNAAISPNEPYIKGTGEKLLVERFDKLLSQMGTDKSIVIETAKLSTFFLEPDTHAPYLSFQSPNKAATWITTGDAYGIYKPTADLFDVLGIRDLTKVGGISSINLHEGSLVSVNTELAERVKIMPRVNYRIDYYDKPVTVSVNYPPETSLTLMPPTLVGFAKSNINYGMNLGRLKGEAGLGLKPVINLKPEVKTFTQPALNLIYEPALKQIPYAQPKLMPQLKPETILEPRLQPASQPALALQPALELRAMPELRAATELRMQTELKTELQMQLRTELMLGFNLKVKPDGNFFWREEGKDWLKMGKKDMFGIGKKDRLRKERFKIEPKSDWLSRLESEAYYGKATNIPNTPKMRREYKKEYYGNPLGMFAGRMPTVEMVKGGRWIWVK